MFYRAIQCWCDDNADNVVAVEVPYNSVSLGLKGIIDVLLKLPGEKDTFMAVELKTGFSRTSATEITHRAQALIYTLLLSEKTFGFKHCVSCRIDYLRPVDSALVPGRRLGDVVDSISIQPRPSDIIGIIQRRNDVAVHLSRALTLPEQVSSGPCNFCPELLLCALHGIAVESVRKPMSR